MDVSYNISIVFTVDRRHISCGDIQFLYSVNVVFSFRFSNKIVPGVGPVVSGIQSYGISERHAIL